MKKSLRGCHAFLIVIFAILSSCGSNASTPIPPSQIPTSIEYAAGDVVLVGELGSTNLSISSQKSASTSSAVCTVSSVYVADLTSYVVREGTLATSSSDGKTYFYIPVPAGRIYPILFECDSGEVLHFVNEDLGVDTVPLRHVSGSPASGKADFIGTDFSGDPSEIVTVNLGTVTRSAAEADQMVSSDTTLCSQIEPDDSSCTSTIVTRMVDKNMWVYGPSLKSLGDGFFASLIFEFNFYSDAALTTLVADYAWPDRLTLSKYRMYTDVLQMSLDAAGLVLDRSNSSYSSAYILLPEDFSGTMTDTNGHSAEASDTLSSTRTDAESQCDNSFNFPDPNEAEGYVSPVVNGVVTPPAGDYVVWYKRAGFCAGGIDIGNPNSSRLEFDGMRPQVSDEIKDGPTIVAKLVVDEDNMVTQILWKWLVYLDGRWQQMTGKTVKDAAIFQLPGYGWVDVPDENLPIVLGSDDASDAVGSVTMGTPRSITDPEFEICLGYVDQSFIEHKFCWEN